MSVKIEIRLIINRYRMKYLINYAPMECTTEIVRTVFDEKFLNSVVQIEEMTKNGYCGDFKVFSVTLDMGRRCLLEENLLVDIEKNGRVFIPYTMNLKKHWFSVSLSN